MMFSVSFTLLRIIAHDVWSSHFSHYLLVCAKLATIRFGQYKRIIIPTSVGVLLAVPGSEH